jgi:arylsulfatase A
MRQRATWSINRHWLAAGLCLVGLMPALAVERSGSGTNIILIMADDLGYETIGANGGESYPTPHLDRMAAAGVRFKHCYAQPLCTPSRVQIMTGKYNVRNYTGFGKLDRKERTFAHVLKEAGYATCIAGKWQLGAEKDAPEHFGFDEALLWQHTRSGRLKEGKIRYDKRFENPLLERNGVEESYQNGEYAPDLMVEFITDFIRKNKEKPFFVYYPMILTHCPFVPTPDSEDWNPESKGSPTYKGNAKYFGEMVAYMDKLVGQLSDHLVKEGLEKNTIILFTGDNGTDKPVVSILNGRKVAGAKGKTTDAGTHVPLIVYGPGRVESLVVDDLVDFSDFLPTFCEIAGIDIPSGLDGQSFYPQLVGETGNPREAIYCWYNRNGKQGTEQVFARTRQYKLYRDGRFFDIPQDPLENMPMKADMLSQDQISIKTMLQEVIDDYEGVR